MDDKVAKSLAKLVRERYNCSFPVDIKKILLDKATVEYRNDIPNNLSAVVVDPKAFTYEKPKVFLSSNETDRRSRFTAAHELGHILLPTHIGINTCNIELNNNKWVGGKPSGSLLSESEADTFAGELLAPASYCKEILLKSSSYRDALIEIYERFEISTNATMCALSKVIEKDYSIIKTERNTGLIWASFTGSETIDRPLVVDTNISSYNDIDIIDQWSSKGVTYTIIKHRETKSYQDITYHENSSRLLDEAIVETFGHQADKKIHKKVYGIIGLANRNWVKVDPNELAEVFERRFRNETISELIHNNKFRMYLFSKAVDCIKRRSQKRKKLRKLK